MPDAHARRRDLLRQTLAGDDIGALLINSATNVGYLTGFSGDSTALIVTSDRDIVVSDGRYTTQLAEECPDLEPRIRPVDQTLTAAIAEALHLLGIGRLGFEANALLVADFDTLRQALPTTSFRGVPMRVEALRAIKDAGEIAAIRRAVAAAERAFTMLMAGLRRDESEVDAADAMEGYLRRCGSSVAAFPPIVAAGPRSALPHARPSPEVRIGDHAFTLVDWGATVDGYRSDLTRVVVTGRVSPKFEEIFRTVLLAQSRAISAIRPGAKARDVDAGARSAIREAGFGDLFLHGSGHGLGLDIHELPRLRPESEDTLEAGMVVTVEPGIYLPDWGGIRIEDDILVTPDGYEILTTVPKVCEAIL